jgi:hypothetical protein
MYRVFARYIATLTIWCSFGLSAATFNDVVGNGNFSSLGLWSQGHVATTGETGRIGVSATNPGPFTVVLDANASLLSLLIGSGSVLTNSTGTSRTLTVGANAAGGLTLNSGTSSASNGNLTIANRAGTGLGLTNIDSSGVFTNGTLQSNGTIRNVSTTTGLIVLPSAQVINGIGAGGTVLLNGKGAKVNSGSNNALAGLSTVSGALTIQNGAQLSTGPNLTNAGTLRITGSDGATSATFSKLTVGSGFGTVTQSAGSTTINSGGSLVGNFVLNGGSFTGSRATVNGTFTNSATGTGAGVFVTDNSSAQNSVLTVLSDFTQAGGVLNFASSTSPFQSTINAMDFIFGGGQQTVHGVGLLEQGQSVGTTEVTQSTSLYVDGANYADYLLASSSYFTIDAGQALAVHNFTASAGQTNVNGTLHAYGQISLSNTSINGNGTFDSPQTTIASQTGLVGSPNFTGNLTADGQFSTDAWWNHNPAAVKTITIGGNFIMGSVDPFASVISMEIGSLTSYDRFVIGGSAILDGGYLDVDMCGFAAPTSYTQWDLIHANGGFTGAFRGMESAFGCTMPAGYSFVQTTNDIYLQFGSPGTQQAQTPEPEAWMLTGVGLVLVVIARRIRHKADTIAARCVSSPPRSS